MESLKVATAFSGGLAACEFAMKYEELEHEVIFACEWDKYARKQYLHFHGEPKTFYEDIQDLDATTYEDKIDLFVFGSPCQDLSLAGKRKGFLGEKSSLFRHGARVLKEMNPKVFIFENVKGLLSSNGGADYKEVIDTFQDLGYLIASKVINAKDQGTAQNRERVFIVGFLSEEDYHNFSFADSVPLTKCLRDYLEDDVDEKYYLSEKMIKGFIHKPNKNFSFKPLTKNSSFSSCLTARYYKMAITDPYIKEPILKQIGELDIKGADSTKRVYNIDGICPTMTTMGGGNRQPKVLLPTVAVKSATKSGYEVATENDSINFTHPDSKTRRGRVGKGVAQTLDCACNQGVVETKIIDFTNSFGEDSVRTYSDVCPTLGSERHGLATNTHDFRIRRLTEFECFRLMGVRDKDIKLTNSMSQSYKIAGNGIEVNTIRSIICQLYKPVKSSLSLF